MKPDLLPHEADAWLQSCRAPLFPTTVHPTEEELRMHRLLQAKHLSDARTSFGRLPALTGDDDIDNDDGSPFDGLCWALRWVFIVCLIALFGALGVGSALWAAGF